jgi:hypothetical protein
LPSGEQSEQLLFLVRMVDLLGFVHGSLNPHDYALIRRGQASPIFPPKLLEFAGKDDSQVIKSVFLGQCEKELRRTYVRWADLAQNHEGGDIETLLRSYCFKDATK